MQNTKVTENINLLTSPGQALQGNVDRAKESSDGGVMDQLWCRFLLFVFGLVFSGT